MGNSDIYKKKKKRSREQARLGGGGMNLGTHSWVFGSRGTCSPSQVLFHYPREPSKQTARGISQMQSKD